MTLTLCNSHVGVMAHSDAFSSCPTCQAAGLRGRLYSPLGTIDRTRSSIQWTDLNTRSGGPCVDRNFENSFDCVPVFGVPVPGSLRRPGNQVDQDPMAEGQVQTATPTPTPMPGPTATAAPVVSEATLPSLTVIHGGRTIEARRFEGCWRPDPSSTSSVSEPHRSVSNRATQRSKVVTASGSR